MMVFVFLMLILRFGQKRNGKTVPVLAGTRIGIYN
jgi:hypothetical protein